MPHGLEITNVISLKEAQTFPIATLERGLGGEVKSSKEQKTLKRHIFRVHCTKKYRYYLLFFPLCFSESRLASSQITSIERFSMLGMR